MDRSRRSLLRGLGLAVAGGTGALGFAEFTAGRSSTEANALVAGSLLELADGIPGATVEAHGSVAVRRLVTDGLRAPDAVALADPRLFSGIAERATLFATNALVIAYHPDSPFAGALASDWSRALEADGIALGRTDPQKDPLGYRTVMAMRLAERDHSVDATTVLDGSDVFLETDLLNVLEGGQVDAAFAYRNMAVQRDLPYVELPVRIDFSDPGLAAHYASVGYDLGGETVRGAPIRYGAAALTDRGGAWVERLVTAAAALRAAGFGVPADYPVRNVVLGGG